MNILSNILKIDDYKLYIVNDIKIKKKIYKKLYFNNNNEKNNFCNSTTIIKYNNIYYLHYYCIYEYVFIICSYDNINFIPLVTYNNKMLLNYNYTGPQYLKPKVALMFEYEKINYNERSITIYYNVSYKYIKKQYFYDTNETIFYIDTNNFFMKKYNKKNKKHNISILNIYSNNDLILIKYYYINYYIYCIKKNENNHGIFKNEGTFTNNKYNYNIIREFI